VKDYIKPAIIGVVVLVIALVVIERSCPKSDEKYNQLKGRYEISQKKIAQEKKELLEEMEKKDEEILELKEKIVVIDEQRIKLDKKDKEKAQTIYELKKERETLEDPYLIIANQDLLLKTWEERWTLEREDKNKVIKQRDYWASMYFKEHKIRQMVEKQLADQEALTKVGEELVKEGEKQIRGLRLKLTLTNILYTAGAGAVGYLLGALK